jgi:hypothetical protein
MLKKLWKDEEGFGILGSVLGYLTGCISGFIAPCGPIPLCFYGFGQMFGIPAGVIGGIGGMIGDLITMAGICITRGGGLLSQNVNSAILLGNNFISHVWKLIGL